MKKALFWAVLLSIAFSQAQAETFFYGWPGLRQEAVFIPLPTPEKKLSRIKSLETLAGKEKILAGGVRIVGTRDGWLTTETIIAQPGWQESLRDFQRTLDCEHVQSAVIPRISVSSSSGMQIDRTIPASTTYPDWGERHLSIELVKASNADTSVSYRSLTTLETWEGSAKRPVTRRVQTVIRNKEGKLLYFRDVVSVPK